MKRHVLAAVVLTLVPVAGVAAMPVSTFVTKAEALRQKGAMALFSGDLKLLTNQVKADSAELRAANKAAEAGGRSKAYCTPASGGSLTQDEIISAMTAVPPVERPRTSTKDALRAYLAKKWPCPASRKSSA